MSVPSLKTRERLSEVRYEIRGELARRARELEAQGRSLIKLNIGNPGAFEQALSGSDTIAPLCAPGGRLHETRRALIDSCAASERLSLVAPQGALYGFPAVVGAAAHGLDDHAFALELLETQDVLIVPGSSFNVPYRNHFRVTLLPEADTLREVFARIERVLGQRAGQRVDAAAPRHAAVA